ncbi:MAG: hypothetical protein O2904_04765, partial [bacterium]|nr:hypothetical protein [bacterium]
MEKFYQTQNFGAYESDCERRLIHFAGDKRFQAPEGLPGEDAPIEKADEDPSPEKIKKPEVVVPSKVKSLENVLPKDPTATIQEIQKSLLT